MDEVNGRFDYDSNESVDDVIVHCNDKVSAAQEVKL